MPIWAQIFVPVLTAVLTLIATTVTTHFLNGPKRRREKEEEDARKRQEEVTSILNKIETLDKNIDAKLEQARANSKALREDIKLLKAGTQAIVKNDLKLQYHEHIEAGWASVDTKEDLERLYQIYHQLGANGVMDGMRKTFMDLPSRPPKANQQ